MIEADFALTGISELATPLGSTALTCSQLGRLNIVENAAVAARDGRVVFTGTEREFHQAVQLSANAVSLDAQGGCVLPGFVDAHTHLPFAGWRESEFDERLRGASYSEIAARGGGILSTVAHTRDASLAQLSALVAERLDEMLALGTTTVEAKSGYGLSQEAELKQLQALKSATQDHPVEIVSTFLGAHTVPLEYREKRAQYVELLVNRLLPEVAASGLAEYADAFVDANAFSVEEARRVLVAAREHGLGVRLHADQLADDGAALLAAELGAASADHLEFASAAGIDALARAGTSGVLLPAATFFLMMDVRPPGRKLPTHSMGAALWFACLTAGLSVDEAITAATLNAACSLGRGSDTGSIEPGKRANLVVHAVPNRYHLVYRFGVPRVVRVIVDGRSVYEKRN